MNKIQKLVESIICHYRTICPFEICEKMNIVVVPYGLPKSVNGFFIKTKESKIAIVINQELNLKSRTEVCAHELGHVLMHNCKNSINMINNNDNSIIELEQEANNFAKYLLSYKDIPDN